MGLNNQTSGFLILKTDYSQARQAEIMPISFKLLNIQMPDFSSIIDLF